VVSFLGNQIEPIKVMGRANKADKYSITNIYWWILGQLVGTMWGVRRLPLNRIMALIIMECWWNEIYDGIGIGKVSRQVRSHIILSTFLG